MRSTETDDPQKVMSALCVRAIGGPVTLPRTMRNPDPAAIKGFGLRSIRLWLGLRVSAPILQFIQVPFTHNDEMTFVQ